MIKRLIYLGMIALLATVSSTKLQAQTPGENIDVTHYEIHLSNFNFTEHTLQGETFVTLNATANTNTIVLELKTLTVTTVLCETVGFGINDWSQNGDFLTITLSETLVAGQTLTLDILYGGNTFNESWGGVHWWGNGYVYNLGVGFESQPHNLGKTWFPCVDDFTDKATYDLLITVDNDKKAICGGNHIGTTDNGNGTSTWHWEVPQEVATYHVSFTIGDYVVWEDTYNGIERDIPVEVYVKPSQINSVPGTFTHVKDIAAFYETNFGPYPFNRIGYICTGQGCMEHIDNIALTGGVITGNTTQEEYVAHELSHMYFGNKTTCSTAGDMWLNEGFAQFCGLFYRIGVYGEDDFQEAMNTKINSIISWCNQESNWIPLNNIPLDMTYDSKAVYDRGAVIVNTMMNYMERDNFLTGINHYLNTYSYGAASSEQLRDALTEATNIDMNGFFDTYVFVGGMPHYDVSIANIAQNGSQYDVTIKMKYLHVGSSHVGQNNRVNVTFINNMGQLQTVMVNWDGAESEQTLTLDIEPIHAFADYDNRFLDAKLDKNLTASSAATLSNTRNSIKVNSVTDSVMLRSEAHLIGPDNDPGIPGLTISTSHYWNIMRLDFGNADVTATFDYSNNSSVDGDIIHTENDSAVLLYRSNRLEPWHTIPYTQQGNWKTGRFTVDDPQSGQYTIGAFDKSLLSSEEHVTNHRLFPNPATKQVTFQWDGETSGIIKIFNEHLQLIKSISFNNTDNAVFYVGDLTPGLYYVECNAVIEKLIIK